MPVKALILFFSFLLAVHALATPHSHRGAHHRALAARVASPAHDLRPLPVRRRQNAKRCRPRSSSVAPSSAPGTTYSPEHSSNKPALLAPTTTQRSTSKSAHTQQPTPAAEPTTSKPQPPATTKQASPPPSSNLPSFLVGTQSGQGTFYATGLGACGIVNTDADHIAAVSHLLFDAFPNYDGNPNHNPVCGRQVKATYQGKSVTVAITDRCTGCAITDLDFSPSAFDILADPSVGRLSDVEWIWT